MGKGFPEFVEALNEHCSRYVDRLFLRYTQGDYHLAPFGPDQSLHLAKFIADRSDYDLKFLT